MAHTTYTTGTDQESTLKVSPSKAKWHPLIDYQYMGLLYKGDIIFATFNVLTDKEKLEKELSTTTANKALSPDTIADECQRGERHVIEGMVTDFNEPFTLILDNGTIYASQESSMASIHYNKVGLYGANGKKPSGAVERTCDFLLQQINNGDIPLNEKRGLEDSRDSRDSREEANWREHIANKGQGVALGI